MQKVISVVSGLCTRTSATLLIVFAVLASIGTAVFHSALTQAATSTTVNFQARLMSSAGAIVPDGDYNVEFKLYNALTSSGSGQGSCVGDSACLWTETRTTTNKVRVVNGYLTVELGSVTALPAIDWSQNLYLTMNIGGTGTASWDGEMSPRLHLTAVPHAFTADQLSTTNGSFTTTVGFIQPSATRSIQFPDASGTVCLQNSSACGFAASSGSGGYIQNGTSLQAGANFNISGMGTAATALQTPLVDTGTATTLNIGTTNATDINLNKDTTVVSGTLNFSNTNANGGNTIKTTTGNLSIRANGTNLLTLNTSGAGTVNVGTDNTTTVNIGGGTDVARTINVGNPASGTAAQAVAVGSLHTTSTTAVQGGTSASAISLTTASGGGITLSSGTISMSTTSTASLSAAGTLSLSGSATTLSSTGGTTTVSAASGSNLILTSAGSATTQLNTGTGGVVVKPGGATTMAFQVQNSSALPLLSVDAANKRVIIGASDFGTGTPNSTATGQLYVAGSVPSAAIGSVTMSDTTYRVVTQGRYAYVQTFGSMKVVDVSNPSSPVIVGSATTTNGVSDVAVSGIYAYSISNGGNTMQIINVANPASPTVFSTTAVTSPYTLAVQGKYLYVGTQDSTNNVRIYDVTNATTPKLIGTLTATASTVVYDLAVQGKYLYLALSSRLQIVDVSNPASPASVGILTTSTAQNVAVQGRYAYLINSGTPNMQIINVANPASPASVSTVATVADPRDISIQGRLAYVTSGTGNAMQWFEVATPASPTSLGSLNLSTALRGISVAGRYAYLADNGGSNLKVVDLGGAYIQQLEVGGVQAATLTVDTNSTLAGDVTIGGGLQVSQSAFVSGYLGVGGQTLFQTATNSTAALQIQNAAGTSNLFIADTTNTRIAIGQAAATYTLDVAGDINSTTQLRVAGTIVCDSTGCTAKSGSGFYIHNQTTVQSANMYVQSATSGTATAILQANATSGNILTLVSGSGSTVGTFGNTGATTLQNATNSTTAFQILAAVGGGGNSVLRVDTTNERVAIGVIADPISAKLNIATGTTVSLRAYQGSTSDIFQLANATGDVFDVSSTGTVTMKTTTNSTNAFQIQSSSSTLLNVDTTNSKLLFGDTVSTKHILMDTSTNDGILEVGATGGSLVLGLKQISSGNAQIYHTADLVVQRTTGTSATDFQVQNASSTPFLTADTANTQIEIGSATTDGTAIILTLDSYNGSSDPTGVAGSMYYSSTWKAMRCYQDGSWSNCSDPTRLSHGFNIQEDFFGSDDSDQSVYCDGVRDIAVSYGWSCWNGGSSTTGFADMLDVDSFARPGQVQLSTGANATGNESLYLAGGGTEGLIIGGGESYETAINIPTLSVAGGQSYLLRMGLCDVNDHGVDCTDGAYFEYDTASSANWRYATAKGGTRTKNSSTKAVATGWTNLKFVATTSSNIDFYVMSAGDTSYTKVGTITTNIPNTTSNRTSMMYIIDKTNGTTARTFAVDYMDYWNDLTTRR